MRNWSICLCIALLTSVALARSEGRLTACKSNLKNIATALEMWSTDNAGRYPASLNQLLPKYLKVIPTCPMAGRDTYSENYQAFTAPDRFGLCCAGANHANVNTPVNFPAYDSYQGLIERDPGPPAKSSECAANQTRLAEELQTYHASQGHYPDQLEKLGTDVPRCLRGSFVYSVDKAGFRVSCDGTAHLLEGLRPYQPALDSRTGPERIAITAPTTPVAKRPRGIFTQSNLVVLVLFLTCGGILVGLMAWKR